MCGIMGFVKTADRTISTPRAITETFKGIAERGTDASGWGMLTEGEISTCKAAVPSYVIAKWKGYKKRLPRADLMVGHARLATSGTEEVNRNNHPHCSKHMINVLIHNGVIYENWGAFDQKSDCDSEILLRMIEKLGMKNACKEMADFDFSWFAWLDLVPREKTIYAFRDSASPCGYIDLTYAIGGILIASTYLIVSDALKRAGIEVPSLWKYWQPLKPLHLYKFKVGKAFPQITKIATPRVSSYRNREYLRHSEYFGYDEYEDDAGDEFKDSRGWSRDKNGVWKYAKKEIKLL